MGQHSKHELTYKVNELAEFLTREMHADSVDRWCELDMTVPQIKTMMLLHHRGPMRMGQIAGYLGSTLSATTSVVDRLVDKGFVGRDSDPDDRRVVICKSTEKGQVATEQFWKIGKDRVALVVDPMTIDQLESLISALEILRAMLEDVVDDSQVRSTG